MKKLVFIFILLSYIFANTNTSSTNAFEDRRAIKLKKGESFIVPFNGWFFSTFSTKRLLIADTEAPSLKAENEKLNLKVEGLEYVNDMYTIKFTAMKTAEEHNKKSRRFQATGPVFYILGVLSGIGLTVATVYAINKASE